MIFATGCYFGNRDVYAPKNYLTSPQLKSFAATGDIVLASSILFLWSDNVRAEDIVRVSNLSQEMEDNQDNIRVVIEKINVIMPEYEKRNLLMKDLKNQIKDLKNDLKKVKKLLENETDPEVIENLNLFNHPQMPLSLYQVTDTVWFEQ